MAFFRLVPNLVIMAPKDFKELEDMLEFAITLKKPVVIRYPRGGEGKFHFEKNEELKLGKAEVLQEGQAVTIIGIGKAMERAKLVTDMLKKENISAQLINARFLKPLDVETIKDSITKTKKVITIEDGTIVNGLGTAVKELIVDENIQDVKIQSYAYPDKFIKHGSVEELEDLYNQDAQYIFDKLKEQF